MKKSLCLTGYGKNLKKNLQFLVTEIPTPNKNDVLIQIKAAGLNPVDYKMIYGRTKLIFNPQKPFAIGFDLAGIIIGKGEDVNDFKLGDEVYSKVPWDQIGTIATHIVVRSNMVGLKPKNLSFIQAAGIPLVGCTVVESMEIAKIKKGDKILIQGGSGGIGTFAIQYAKYLGAEVYSTTSTGNVELVKSLGADVVIDYKNENYKKVLSDMDVVYDTVGGKYTRQAYSVTKKGGKIIAIVGHYDTETLKVLGISKILIQLNKIKGFYILFRANLKKITFKHVFSYPNQKTLNFITQLIEEKEIIAVNDRVFPFEDAIEAISYLKSNRAKGKVIIEIH